MYKWQSLLSSQSCLTQQTKADKINRGGLSITRANDLLNPRYFSKPRLPFSDGVRMFGG